MKINRVWAMPSRWTFDCKPIKELVARYGVGKGWADPFAGKSILAEHRNDLNPEHKQPSQMDATEFLTSLTIPLTGVLFDPPYSMEQIKRSYSNVGITDWQTRYGNNKAGNFAPVKDIIATKLNVGGLVISFGWNTSGMGIKRNFEIVEVLVVAHGGNRNDTLVTVERKL